jgi:hypothetical protein
MRAEWRAMNLANSLQRVALSDPRRPAVFHGPRLLRDYAAFAKPCCASG